MVSESKPRCNPGVVCKDIFAARPSQSCANVFCEDVVGKRDEVVSEGTSPLLSVAHFCEWGPAREKWLWDRLNVSAYPATSTFSLTHVKFEEWSGPRVELMARDMSYFREVVVEKEGELARALPRKCGFFAN